MPKYRYKAQNEKGKNVSGTMQANDENELHVKLREQNMYLISAKEDGRKRSIPPFKTKELADFSRQIGTMVGSGVSLVRTLNIVASEEGIKPNQRMVYEDVQRLVRQGVPLSDAMEQQGDAFPPMLIHMFRSAEVSGNLDKTAMRMSIHYDKTYKIEGKVKSSMVYPKILAIMLVGVLIIIMSYVVPQFSEMFAEMETLPILTTILLAMSDFIAAHWLGLIIGLVCGVSAIKLILKVPAVRYQKDRLILKMPLIGPLEKVIFTANFARTLSSMYSSGIPIIVSLDIAKKTIGNTYIEGQFDSVVADVRSGANLSDALDKVDGLVKKLIASIKVGEETGTLDTMLDSIADTMDYDSEMAIQRLVSYLEPVMIIFMGLMIAVIMIGVIMPIYGSYETIGGSEL